jgi:uncharacterized membrane protein
MPSARNFFSDAEKKEIIKAIQLAEKVTSGEIKVHVEESCGTDVLQRAEQVFQKLNLHHTALRNGVLIYLSIKTRQFAILGDKGINEKAPATLWDTVKEGMQAEFSKGSFLEGLLQAIRQVGEQLHTHFPAGQLNQNELSDEISFLE